jgi:tRNA U34 5-methylaminomethyl-2-thiouridine-forming methyltransferase MnmC
MGKLREQGAGSKEQGDKGDRGVTSPSSPPSPSSPSSLTPQVTADGSFTFFSPEFSEAFHSHYGARQEAELKFVEPTQLKQKAQSTRSLRLLDVCYGLGYNTAAALAAIWAVNPDCYIEVVGLELNPAVPQAAIAHHLLNSWSQPIPQILTQLASYQVQTDRLQAKLLVGDARQTIQPLIKASFQADAIFLDPFSPPVCPQLWTVEFLALVAQCLHSNGRLATYSSAAAVRTALIAAGLKIGSTQPVGRRSPGTIASWVADGLPALSWQEQEHLLTRAAIPYRDPHLSDCADLIRQRRSNEQSTSDLEPASHWRKRIQAIYK